MDPPRGSGDAEVSRRHRQMVKLPQVPARFRRHAVILFLWNRASVASREALLEQKANPLNRRNKASGGKRSLNAL